ncbi:MAG: LLM class flavin-dependent oxidoreductase [bacterium]|nr:LLM class flavin-dependent oxidoreductase [Deltaproteobacteria bacterium]MCP4905354.1 LLM class flavin-dependent oxidoreductase [bacterium]
MTQLSMRFDLRVPPFAQTSFAEQHGAMLEMASWAERVGVATIMLSEHHGDPAGFTSSPLTIAAAVLARTSRLKVSIQAALVPLHDPVRLAEQIATIDCMAPGRLSVVVGAGYRHAEFEMAGIERSDRGRLLEECVGVLRSAWSGERFEWQGREILATPPPAIPGGPDLFVGGKTVAGAKRAARLRCRFSPAVSTPEVIEAYFDESARLGFDSADVYGCVSMDEFRARHLREGPAAPGFVMVSKDPDATWKRIGPYAEYDAVTYAAWQEDGVVSDWAVPGAETWEHLRESGNYSVVTPRECVELGVRDGHIMLHPLMGGIEPEIAWESLRLFESEVLPHLE